MSSFATTRMNGSCGLADRLTDERVPTGHRNDRIRAPFAASSFLRGWITVMTYEQVLDELQRLVIHAMAMYYKPEGPGPKKLHGGDLDQREPDVLRRHAHRGGL
jgi:hypothetical protein